MSTSNTLWRKIYFKSLAWHLSWLWIVNTHEILRELLNMTHFTIQVIWNLLLLQKSIVLAVYLCWTTRQYIYTLRSGLGSLQFRPYYFSCAIEKLRNVARTTPRPPLPSNRWLVLILVRVGWTENPQKKPGHKSSTLRYVLMLICQLLQNNNILRTNEIVETWKEICL